MNNPKIGDRVVTNNLEWGVIESLDGMFPDPWFNVRLDNGRIELQNACRMSTRHPFGDPDPRGHDDQRRAGRHPRARRVHRAGCPRRARRVSRRHRQVRARGSGLRISPSCSPTPSPTSSGCDDGTCCTMKELVPGHGSLHPILRTPAAPTIRVPP